MMLARLVPVEGLLSCRHLVHDGAKREDVRPRISRSRFKLLRSHVLKGAEDRPFLGERLGACSGLWCIGVHRSRCAQRSYSEVEQLRAGSRQHDVCRLQIPVDDSVAMRMVECISNLDGEAQDQIERQRTSREALRQRLSLDVLHHDELNAVLFTDIVEGTDVRMVHLGDGPGLALEPLDGLGILRPVRLQDLDSHSPVEARVGRAIDLAHASGAEPRNNHVRDRVGRLSAFASLQ